MRARSMVLLPILVSAVASAATHPFQFDDMAKLGRLGDYDVSRDGKWVVYAVTRTHLAENTTTTSIWIQSTDGATPARRLTDDTKKDHSPRLSPDGKTVAFISDRDGSPQLWLLDISGGAPRPLAAAPDGFEEPMWSPDGSFIVAVTEVPPECHDLKCAARASEHAKSSKVKVRIVERLFFRYWDSWRDGKRKHLYRVDVKTGAARDLTPGNFDAIPLKLGGAPDFDIAPDGKTVVYASNHNRVEAAGPDSDIFEVSLATNQVRCLSCENRAYDGAPRYSPDGRTIAWHAKKRPGAESDKDDLVVYDRNTGRSRRLTEKFADWVEEIHWTADSRRIVFTSVVAGRKPLYEVSIEDDAIKCILPDVSADDPVVLADGTIIFMRSSFQRAPELWRFDGKTEQPLTHINDYSGLALGGVSERQVEIVDGPNGGKMQAFVITPPHFDPTKKYPALLWVHGGPEIAWLDHWHWRWNPQVLASAGYVIYMPNPHGSTGFGHKKKGGDRRMEDQENSAQRDYKN